jgi:hypothetical protein
MPEPTYSLPITLLGTKSRSGLFMDGVPAEVRGVLALHAHRYESVDGNGETISLWPHPEEIYEKHRATAALITHCFWPWELADVSPEGRMHFIRRLGDEIARSKAWLLNQHWAMDGPAHFALNRCLAIEIRLASE